MPDPKAEAAQIAELLIYDTIGSDMWGEGVAAADVVNWLAEQDANAEIHVRVNSPGGYVFEGTAIYNALAHDPRRVVMHIDGLAASAASEIVMAGDEIRIAANAVIMIHNAAGFTIGTAADHDDTAEILRRLDAALAKTYAARTGGDLGEIKAWMDAETWMDADEALERGFATEVVEAKKAEARWGRRGHEIAASFKHPPQQLSPSLARPMTTQIAAMAAEEKLMDPTKICAALGLPEDAKTETIVAAIQALSEKSESAATIELAAEPDPVAWVARADLDEERAKRAALEKKVLARDTEDAIKAAEGKLVFSDADRDRFRKHIESGAMTLDAFREEIAARELSPLAVKDEVQAHATTDTGLSPAEVEHCEKHNLNKELFAKNKAKRAGRIEA